MIRLQSVSKVYGVGPGAVRAVDNLTLEIGTGEFVSVMGASGSGKSTLLNLISALDVPSSGCVSLAGQDIQSMNDDQLTLFRRRRVGLVFQFFNLLPTLDVLQNILLPVMLERKVTPRDEEHAKALLEEVGLHGREHHRLSELSGGQQQRVAIARALILEPAIVLADEPTGSLDSKTGAAVLSLLGRCCETSGATVVLVTHDPQAAELAERMIILHDGQLVDDRPSSGAHVERSRALIAGAAQ